MELDCDGSMMQTNCPMTLGDWTEQTCPEGELICGVRTQLQEPQGAGDDTSINGIQFICCNNYPVIPGMLIPSTKMKMSLMM